MKDWKIFVDDQENYQGTPDQLTADSQFRIEGLQSGPGNEVKITVTVTKSDESVVHPILNYYATLREQLYSC